MACSTPSSPRLVPRPGRVPVVQRAIEMVTISSSLSPRSVYTFERDRSAAFTSNDGFSVVAPIRTMSPASTRGRNASAEIVDSVDLVDKRSSGDSSGARLLGDCHDLLDFLDAREHSAEGDEPRPCRFCD